MNAPRTDELLAAILAEIRAIRRAGSAEAPSHLLLALGAYYGDGDFTHAEAASDTDRDADLSSAVSGIGGPERLGLALRALANRPAGGLVLVACGRNRRNATEWRVVTDMQDGMSSGLSRECANVGTSSKRSTHEGMK